LTIIVRLVCDEKESLAADGIEWRTKFGAMRDHWTGRSTKGRKQRSSSVFQWLTGGDDSSVAVIPLEPDTGCLSLLNIAFQDRPDARLFLTRRDVEETLNSKSVWDKQCMPRCDSDDGAETTSGRTEITDDSTSKHIQMGPVTHALQAIKRRRSNHHQL
jgi:hypothetical protein